MGANDNCNEPHSWHGLPFLVLHDNWVFPGGMKIDAIGNRVGTNTCSVPESDANLNEGSPPLPAPFVGFGFRSGHSSFPCQSAC